MRRTRLAGRLFAATLVFLCNASAAIDWPSADAVMVRNFGYNDRGRPVLGTVFEGEGQVVAAGEGELIFFRTEENTASRLPSPLGAWSAVDHGDGLVSIYGRYGDEGGKLPLQTAAGSPIAPAGISGWSRRDGFYFGLYDRRERRWVNPSMVITPFPDTVPPQITGIQLRNAQGSVLEGVQLRNISQGRYTISVHAFDTLPDAGGIQLAPHRIVCSMNGIEAGALSFETICARDGVLMVNRNGLVPALRVYAPYPAFEAGEVQISRGQAMLEIIVQDIAGNSRSANTRMIVE